MTDVARTVPGADTVSVRVYATMDGTRVSARWSAGEVGGDRRLCDRLEGPIEGPLEFISACERVVDGPVGVAIGQLAEGSWTNDGGNERP